MADYELIGSSLKYWFSVKTQTDFKNKVYLLDLKKDEICSILDLSYSTEWLWSLDHSSENGWFLAMLTSEKHQQENSMF